jgi:hypothetical protein
LAACWPGVIAPLRVGKTGESGSSKAELNVTTPSAPAPVE